VDGYRRRSSSRWHVFMGDHALKVYLKQQTNCNESLYFKHLKSQ